MSELRCRIVTPHGLYRELHTSILNVETLDGQRGILPNHMPLVTMLKIGKMTTVENGERVEYALSGGLLYFRDNVAEILTHAIESKEEIDVARAEEAKARSERRIKNADSNVDLKRAEIALERAMNRLRVKNR